MFDDYSLASIKGFVSLHAELVLEDPPGIILVSQIDPGLDLEEGPIDLLYRFSDDQKPALAFERVTEDIYTTRFVSDRIAEAWGDAME
jgi:hypothetical protein